MRLCHLLTIATQTPNSQALERFGTLGADGQRRPFHTYHLGQAVSDGLVMDPRLEYNEVLAVIGGLDKASVSEKETWAERSA